jgi:hypothetical protein
MYLLNQSGVLSTIANKSILFMTKRIVLTALVAFLATVVALAQTDPAPSTQPSPANKTAKVQKAQKAQKKDKAAKVEHAEERSNGAAFSGKGKGGEKNMTDKTKKDKAKAKKKGQKNKQKNKAKKQGAQNGKTYEGTDDKAPSDGSGQEQRPGGTNKEKPNTTTPARKQRQPGDKPTSGTEQKKDNKSRG